MMGLESCRASLEKPSFQETQLGFSARSLTHYLSRFKDGRTPMQTYRAAVIGCSRMGAFIDNERVGHLASEVADLPST